jgi:hypothetical protein
LGIRSWENPDLAPLGIFKPEKALGLTVQGLVIPGYFRETLAFHDTLC